MQNWYYDPVSTQFRSFKTIIPKLYKMVKRLLNICLIILWTRDVTGVKLDLQTVKPSKILQKTRPYVISIIPIFLRATDKQSPGSVP